MQRRNNPGFKQAFGAAEPYYRARCGDQDLSPMDYLYPIFCPVVRGGWSFPAIEQALFTL